MTPSTSGSSEGKRLPPADPYDPPLRILASGGRGAADVRPILSPGRLVNPTPASAAAMPRRSGVQYREMTPGGWQAGMDAITRAPAERTSW
jgi:hypothetical protein